MVLLKACPREFAFERGESVRKQVENLSWTPEKGKKFSINISFGVVQYESGETQEEVISRVDQALYRAKREGKNRGERG